MNHLFLQAAVSIVTENCHCSSKVIFKLCKACHSFSEGARHADRQQNTLAERSKALAQGTIPKGRGLEPHKCHCDGVTDVSNTACHDAFFVSPGNEQTLFDQCKLPCRSVECQLVPAGASTVRYRTVPYGGGTSWYQLVPAGSSWFQPHGN